MVALLGLLFLAVPLIELYLIIQVASGIGIPETILALVGISVAGAWLVKREGIGVMRRIQQSLARYELPERDLVDGALILLAGALLITPGFMSDVLGLVLLVPPTRALVRAAVLRRFRRRQVIWIETTGHPAPGQDTWRGSLNP